MYVYIKSYNLFSKIENKNERMKERKKEWKKENDKARSCKREILFNSILIYELYFYNK